MIACDFLTVQTYDGLVLARIGKDRLVDAPAINSLHGALTEHLNRCAKPSLILDVAVVAYMSSAVLGKFVALQKQVKLAKGRIAIAGLKPNLLPLFKVTSLDRLFDFFPEAEQALLQYRRNPI
jgi:anti-sigma B factor antagonist